MFNMSTGRFGGGRWHQPWKAHALMNECLKLASVEGARMADYGSEAAGQARVQPFADIGYVAQAGP